jgi:hypothetical protein
VLEKRIVNEADIFGLGHFAITPGSTRNKGTFVYMNGVHGTDNATYGYAQTNDIKFSAVATAVIATGVEPCYVMDKLEFQPEDSDLTLDTINSGEGIRVFMGGTFETDQYSTTINSAFPIGDKLTLDSSGLLASGAGLKKVAIFLGLKSSFDSNYSAKALLMFKMLPVAQ